MMDAPAQIFDRLVHNNLAPMEAKVAYPVHGFDAVVDPMKAP